MNKRRQKTRTAILDAFSDLLGEVGYSKMTVADILERAGVGRTTFYDNFSGKDELLQLQVKAICGLLLEDAQDDEPVDARNALERTEVILQNIQNSCPGVKSLITGEGSERFADCLRHAIVERASRCVPPVPSGPAARMNRAFLLHHIAASFVGMVRWWAWTGYASTPHDLAADYVAAILPVFGE